MATKGPSTKMEVSLCCCPQKTSASRLSPRRTQCCLTCVLAVGKKLDTLKPQPWYLSPAVGVIHLPMLRCLLWVHWLANKNHEQHLDWVAVTEIQQIPQSGSIVNDEVSLYWQSNLSSLTGNQKKGAAWCRPIFAMSSRRQARSSHLSKLHCMEFMWSSNFRPAPRRCYR